MDLDIFIIDRIPKLFNDDLYCTIKGRIKIADFEEDFHSPLAWWSAQDYEYQWREGLKRLKSYDTSCLITSVYDPKKTRFLMWWLLYKRDDKIYIHNQMLLSKIYKKQIDEKNFNIDTCYNFIPPYSREEDGLKVSEWVVDYP